MNQSSGVPSDEELPDDGGAGPAPRPENAPSAGGIQAADAQTIGEQLRHAREAAGLTLAEIAQRTKIRPGILAAIDDDAHDQLPALTYSLGFVKAYARTVGLDPAQAGERYRLESQKADPVPTIVDLQPLERKRQPSGRLALVAGGVLLLVLAGFWAWGAGWLNSEVAAPQVPAAGVQPPEMQAANATAPAATASMEVLPRASAGPAVDPAAPVTLTAKEEVWLRISDGDETFYMGTMPPGQVLTLPAGRAWTLRTGRAGALEVKLGARVLPPLGGPVEQVHGLSLKPADLLARPAPAPAPVAAPAPAAATAPRPQG